MVCILEAIALFIIVALVNTFCTYQAYCQSHPAQSMLSSEHNPSGDEFIIQLEIVVWMMVTELLCSLNTNKTEDKKNRVKMWLYTTV